MAFGLIGRKVGMTQVFTSEGLREPVTVVETGPCVVLQKKTGERDGYNALQLGYLSKPVQWKSKAQGKMGGKRVRGTRKKNSVTRPMFGHFKAAGKGAFRFIKEFRLENVDDYEVGQEITLVDFLEGEKISVTGASKGKGFQGVIKRHGFSGGRKTHGSRLHREPGAIGACATPSKVFKNKPLPGQMGNSRVTTKNLRIVKVDAENNLLFIRGAVPGPTSGVIYICKNEAGS